MLNYIWRIIATGFCFFIFGVGGLILSLFIFPLIKLIYRNEIKRKKQSRKTIQYLFKFFIKTMSVCKIFTFDLSETDFLKNLKGHLILANHPSLIDVVVLISILPNADCIVKAHLFKNLFLRGVVKSIGYISNSTPDGLIADCEESLRSGNNLIVFPQGTRSQLSSKIKFQRGAANIALRCQASVELVLIKVIPSALTKNEPWFKVPVIKPTFSVKKIENMVTIQENTTIKMSKQVREYNRTLENLFIEELRRYE